MNNTRMPLFDVCAARHGGADTSVQAAASVGKEVRALERGVVLDIIRRAGTFGLTLDELAGEMKKFPNAVSGRVTELRAMGKIFDTGRRRPTASGRSARVYRVTNDSDF